MPEKLGIVIPCFEDLSVLQFYLPGILNRIGDRHFTDIVIVDAFEDQDRKAFANKHKVKYYFAEKAQRSVQLNIGASLLNSENLFFLHIDSMLPRNFERIIQDTLNSGYQSGAFQLAFHPSHPFLNFFAWFTRFKWARTRGDQGLFLKRTLFEKLGGYREDYNIMADVDLSTRLIKQSSFRILPQKITTSSRKYEELGMVKLQAIFGLLTVMHWLGFSNKRINRVYQYFARSEQRRNSIASGD